MIPNRPILEWCEQSPGVFQTNHQMIGIGKKSWYRVRFSFIVGPISVYWHTEYWDGLDYHELEKSVSLRSAQSICENHAERLDSYRRLSLGDIVSSSNLVLNAEGIGPDGKRVYQKIPRAVVTSLNPFILKSVCGKHSWTKDSSEGFFKVVGKATSKQMVRLQG